MRVLVIGGRGLFGRGVVQALQGHAEVQVAGRSGPVRVDLRDPRSFGPMAEADYTVNCSDTVEAPPDEAIARTLDGGRCFVETGAHPQTLERLLERFHRRQGHNGLTVLGVGLFPGLSNLLAAQTARELPDGAPLTLGLRFSPLSEGGPGMARLAAAALAVSPAYVEQGVLHHDPHLLPGPWLPWSRGPAPSLSAPMPDVAMLHRSISTKNLRMYWSPDPPALEWVLRWTAALAPAALVGSGGVQRVASWLTTLLRARLLRGRASPVELLAQGPEGQSLRRLRVEDGVRAGGVATAATVLGLERRSLWRSGRRTGLYLCEELLGLDEVLVEMRRLAPELTLEAHPEPRPLEDDPPTPTAPLGAP